MSGAKTYSLRQTECALVTWSKDTECLPLSDVEHATRNVLLETGGG